jgi:hypothetical protein
MFEYVLFGFTIGSIFAGALMSALNRYKGKQRNNVLIEKQTFRFFAPAKELVLKSCETVNRYDCPLEVSNVNIEFPQDWVLAIRDPRDIHVKDFKGGNPEFAPGKRINLWSYSGSSKEVSSALKSFLEQPSNLMYLGDGYPRCGSGLTLSFDLSPVKKVIEAPKKEIEVSKEELIAKLASVMEVEKLTEENFNIATNALKEDEGIKIILK